MEIQKQYKEYFSDFEVSPAVEEPSVMYLTLFEVNNELKIKQQFDIISNLEKKFKITNASKFENLVHFQHAGLQPVQRWFDYREGYTTNLVTIFIKELNIKGNVLDPFCGSGTTLLAARKADIQSFGFEVNPISSFVAKCENSNYSDADIISTLLSYIYLVINKIE